jgi:hypothetical protein
MFINSNITKLPSNHILFILKQIIIKVKYHFIGFDSILFLNFQTITFLNFIDEIKS